MTRDAIIAAVIAERSRQHDKWAGPHAWGAGDCSSPDVTDTTKATVLLEEAGEVARAVLEQDPDALRVELVQVAAVAVAWLEGLP
jgi:hypothetical protein